MSNNNGMLTEYQQNDAGIFEYKVDHNFRLPGPMQGIRSANDKLSAFYVKVDSVRTPFGTIPPEFTTDFVHLVRIVADSLLVEEKILSLRKHSYYIEITDGGNSMTYSSLPYRYSDYFHPLTDKFLLVKRPSKSVIQIYDENMRLFHELKLNIKERLITENDMEYHFSENSQAERRDRRALIKDIKTPFTGVMMDDQKRFWLLTDKTENGNEYVILSYEGTPLGRFFLPSNSILHAVKNGKLYLINNEEETFIEVYSVNL